MESKLLHPEKREVYEGPYFKQLQQIWNRITREEGAALENLENFKEAYARYISEVMVLSTIEGKKGTQVGGLDLTSLDTLQGTGIFKQMQIQLAYGRVVQDYLTEQQVNPSYTSLATDPRCQIVWDFDWKSTNNMLKDTISRENHVTDLIVRHAIKLLSICGNKIYTISHGLQLQLEYTELKRYPASGIRLPFPAIYVNLPSKYSVYNEDSGWHPSEGVYIVEDTVCVPRSWRMILVGLPKEESKTFEDDALYHWSIQFPDNHTIEEALQVTLDHAYTQMRGGEVYKYIKQGDKTVAISVQEPQGEEREEHFNLMKSTLLRLFRYIMNVVLYATHPEADTILSDASKEYTRLRARASKLPKGSKKKRKLLDRVKKIEPRPRIVLGGAVVIDRQLQELSSTESKSGGKHKVRSLVSGHWHGYWTGKGRTTYTSKFVEPYWKGPEHAPLTRKGRSLK